MNSIRLVAEDGRLLLEASAPDWIRCTLLREGHVIFLGAESPKYIHERLVRALADSGQALDGEVDGHKVFRVLSLFEGHYILYASEEGDERYLFWQDAGRSGTGLQRMHLTGQQRRAWIVELEELLVTETEPQRGEEAKGESSSGASH